MADDQTLNTQGKKKNNLLIRNTLSMLRIAQDKGDLELYLNIFAQNSKTVVTNTVLNSTIS